VLLDGIEGFPPKQYNSKDVVKEKSDKVAAGRVTLDGK